MAVKTKTVADVGFDGDRDDFPAVKTAIARLESIQQRLQAAESRLDELVRERPRLLREAEAKAIGGGVLVDLAGETREAEANVRLLSSAEKTCVDELKAARRAADRQIAINLLPSHIEAARKLVACLSDVADAMSEAREIEAEAMIRGADGISSPLVTVSNERAQDVIDVWVRELSDYVKENENHD